MTSPTNKTPHLQPGITVVIPVYNRAEMVLPTLTSIQQQTFRPMNVVLVDNNSSDSTADTLQKWAAQVQAPDFNVRITSELYPSAAAARQNGASIVNTEYVLFFDSDDIMLPNHIERVNNALSMNPDADIVGWNFPLLSSVGKRIRTCRFYHKDLIWHGLINGSFSTVRYALRTQLLYEAGGWNAEIKGWDDMELGVRLALQHPSTIKLSGKHSIEVVSHPDSITGTKFSDAPEKWEATLNAIDALMPTRRYRRMALLKRAILAGDYRKEGALNECSHLMSIISEREKCPFYRFLFHTAMLWEAYSLPGISIVFRPFF